MRDQTVLITGGTGSLGQALMVEFEKMKTNNSKSTPKKIIIFSRNEYAQYEMRKRFENLQIPTRFFIGDVRDQERLNMAFQGVDVVIHTAALKHVDVGEYNPFESIQTNIIGTQNVIKAALSNDVREVIGVSTDKAVNPANLYGATKLCADKLFMDAHNYAGGKFIKFNVVRFGNFWASNGSVVPFFFKLKNEGKKELPITDFRMSRFFIGLDEAAQFIIEEMYNTYHKNAIYIPKMRARKITDIAKSIHPDVVLKEIGLKSGEKLYEEMVADFEVNDCYDKKYYYLICKNYHGKKVPSNFKYTSEEVV